MPSRLWILPAFALAAFLCLPSAHAAQQMKAGSAAVKLGRGAVNVVTGWVEIPKRIYETSTLQGAFTGWTWGLLRGLGHGFVRTVAGFYEVFTFPVPQPPDYAPVIQPEYVFVDESTATASTNANAADYKYR